MAMRKSNPNSNRSGKGGRQNNGENSVNCRGGGKQNNGLGKRGGGVNQRHKNKISNPQFHYGPSSTSTSSSLYCTNKDRNNSIQQKTNQSQNTSQSKCRKRSISEASQSQQSNDEIQSTSKTSASKVPAPETLPATPQRRRIINQSFLINNIRNFLCPSQPSSGSSIVKRGDNVSNSNRHNVNHIKTANNTTTGSSSSLSTREHDNYKNNDNHERVKKKQRREENDVNNKVNKEEENISQSSSKSSNVISRCRMRMRVDDKDATSVTNNVKKSRRKKKGTFSVSG